MPTMTLEQINDSIRTVGARVNDLSARLALAATQAAPDLQEVARLQDELQAQSASLNALRQSAQALSGSQEAGLQNQPAQNAQQERNLSALRKSNEYARAFAFAIRNGFTPATGRGMEQLKPLYDALTIGGGTPTGSDGGFLVPEDIDHQIRELQRELNPLRAFFETETVTTNSGWRVKDNAPTNGFTAVNETAAVPRDSQPSFGKVTYALTKYGLILPVSNELASDEVANLFAYISRWAAKKETITENTLLLAALATATAVTTAIAANSEIKNIKHALNVDLDPAIGRSAIFLTNQDGFDILDGLEDEQGRPLMQWNPTEDTPRFLHGHRVAVVSNAVLASTTGTGAAAPLYIGDARQFATLFERAAMEVLSTNIGGNAFNNDTTEIRFIKRMGVSKFDTDAVRKASLAL